MMVHHVNTTYWIHVSLLSFYILFSTNCFNAFGMIVTLWELKFFGMALWELKYSKCGLLFFTIFVLLLSYNKIFSKSCP